MTISQYKTREATVFIIYSMQMGAASTEDVLPLVMGTLALSRGNVKLSNQLAINVIDKIMEFDPMIEKASIGYEIDRISKLDKALIYWALYEIFENNADISLIISEAVRMSKKFSVPTSSGFIHAIIDTVCKENPRAISV